MQPGLDDVQQALNKAAALVGWVNIRSFMGGLEGKQEGLEGFASLRCRIELGCCREAIAMIGIELMLGYHTMQGRLYHLY